MYIIKDETDKVLEEKFEFVKSIIQDTISNTYECKCGLTFKPDIFDFNVSKFEWYITYNQIGFKCPHCGHWHSIKVDQFETKNYDEAEICALIASTIHKMRKDYKKTLRLNKKRTHKLLKEFKKVTKDRTVLFDKPQVVTIKRKSKHTK